MRQYATSKMIKEISATNIIDALESGDLLWDPIKTPIQTCDIINTDGSITDGKMIRDHFSITRSDTHDSIGVVGTKYHPISNSAAFSFFDEIVEKHGATYTRAACVDGGSRVFLQAKLDKSFTIGNGDQTDLYVTLMNSHDGSSSLYSMITPIRLFCSNQLNAAMKQAVSKIKITHTASAEGRMADALQIYGSALTYFDKFEEAAIIMANKMVDRATLNAFIDTLMTPPADNASSRSATIYSNKREKVIELFEEGKGNNGQTMWDLYNGVTEYVDHYFGSDIDKRFVSSLVGAGATLKNRAFNTAMAMC
jgi:phage/plasmid-like protein (TIGR03299 family)